MRDEMLSDPRITAVGLLAEAYAGLIAKTSAQFADHRLGHVDFEVLLRLARSSNGRLRMTDLAAQTGLSTSGVTRVVDRLERDDMVERLACKTDRRGSFTVITEAGYAKLTAVLPGHLELIEKWFTGRFTPDELASLLAGIRQLRDAVRPEATSGVS